MTSSPSGTQLFICPKCRETYLGGPRERLPDCPHCGYDYRTSKGIRFDLLAIMVLIIAMIGFLVLSSSYRSGSAGSSMQQSGQGDLPEKLPGR
jgi:uncharacterized protein (DUF983 family)